MNAKSVFTVYQVFAGRICKIRKEFFVRQSFARTKKHFDKDIKGCYIITHYPDIVNAQHHMMAISHDAYRYLYEWDNPDHQKRLYVAADNPPGYKVYSCVFNKDWGKQIEGHLKEKTRGFIEKNIGWKPGRSDTVNFNIYANNGELYAKLKLRAEEVRIKLEEIENF